MRSDAMSAAARAARAAASIVSASSNANANEDGDGDVSSRASVASRGSNGAGLTRAASADDAEDAEDGDASTRRGGSGDVFDPNCRRICSCRSISRRCVSAPARGSAASVAVETRNPNRIRRRSDRARRESVVLPRARAEVRAQVANLLAKRAAGVSPRAFGSAYSSSDKSSPSDSSSCSS